MKLIASFLSLTLVAALSAWLWLGQSDPTDIETAGVQVGASGTGQTQDGPVRSGGAVTPDHPLFTDDHAAAFVGLQAVLDVWQTQPREVLANPEALNKLLADARTTAEAEVAAQEQQAKEEAAAKKKAEEEAAAAKKAEEEAAAQKKAEEEAAAREAAPPPPKAVSPPPVAPAPPAPPPGCEWDDDEWDCDDDDDDDWDDDDDDDDDWDDDDDD